MLVVFGSINADLVFRVRSLPGPGETVLAPGYNFAPGGKGANQATAAAKAGASVRFVGRVGDDGFAEVLREVLLSAGVDAIGLWSVPGATGVAMIAVDAGGENQIIVGSGANASVAADDIPLDALGAGVTLLCQNELNASATAEAMSRARSAGCRTIFNFAPVGPIKDETLKHVDILVVNEHEVRVAAGGDGDATELARQLAVRHSLACIVTLGPRGVSVAEKGRVWQVPALPVEPIDTTGAGDCFVGVLAAGLDGGLDLEQAVRRSAVAAALSCKKLGAQAGQPSADAVSTFLPSLGPTTAL